MHAFVKRAASDAISVVRPAGLLEWTKVDRQDAIAAVRSTRTDIYMHADAERYNRGV